MSSSGQRTFNAGYRSWFRPFRYNQKVTIPIFILDYETASFWEEQYDDYLDQENRGTQANTQLINGIQVYFLDENLQKRKAFLRHEPYFYLLLEEGLSKQEKNRISTTIREMGESQVIHVEEGEYYDAANLTFLVKKSFMKVTVDRPGSVPSLRTKTEEINGVLEWREADVLFHHRTAIDHNVRVGSWYTADIAGGKIQALSNIPNRAPPALRVLAFDIETVFEQTRDPTPNRDAISMISLFTGDKDIDGNILIVNSQVVETKDLKDFNILLKASDKDHSKPWVDWSSEEDLRVDSKVIERFPTKVIVTKNEKELLDYFYQFIRRYQPDVLTDFFGGRFDIPFLAIRSEKYGISFEKETGFRIVFKYRLRGKRGDLTDLKSNYSPNNFDYVAGAGIIHLDAYLFNEKYSYLPKKDLGLKPSVERKLKIIPIGREALFAIKDNPVEAVAYAASDGYITWKYVKEIVLDFFISMGQMFPVPASELLTRRSGSLDDLLIDAEDYQHQVIGKKRIGQTNVPSFSSGVVIESLAYTGGLVEARRPGLFRSDIFFDYEPDKVALENLKEIIRRAINKESQNLVKSIKKEEFERLIGSELEDMRFEYSEDPIIFLSQLETDLLKNGISAEEISKQLESVRKILEKTTTLHVVNVEQVINETCKQLDQLIALEGKTQLRGVHVDVTSMYPSQIRQYKLQPSGIVPLTMCRTCELREADNSCFFEGDWVIKLTARRPCRFKVEGSGKCDPSICTAEDEMKCKKYDPSPHERSRSQEIFTFNGKKTEAYLLTDNSRLEQVPIGRTYLGSNISEDPFVCLQRWLLNSVEATQLTTNLDQNQFDIFEDQSKDIKLPSNTFMSLDVRTKKITVLLSVNSRVCQKAYNFVSRIMDDFFNTRVKHKVEAQRLKQVISQKLALNQPVNPDLLRQQKFHDSTQLGMKVPLNSIYGLLGMKGGVRNASMPCAGITTKLSADLIHWAANQLEQIGLVTELDTDGVWLWVPTLFPLEMPITVRFPYKNDSTQVYKVSLIDKILNEKVISTGFRNDNYWVNDGKKISRSSKSLIKFEQDGPYDFQFVMGKKKYIVYNYDEKKSEWIEEELTGLESKRADFSQLQKYFQERIINSYLQQYDPVNPIPLDRLYQNAIEAANQIRTEMIDGYLDPSYFVKPKAINKPLKAYKSKLPQVSAAYILKDLGFSVDPGTRIQMLNIKGNHVIPRQIFDFDFKKIKEVLVKHAVCTLSFMLGELSTKEDLRKLIDIRQYQEDIFGPGRIYDRMIRYPMEIQKITATTQQILDINDIEDLSTERKIGVSIDEEDLSVSEKKSPIKKRKDVKQKKREIPRRSRRRARSESKKPQIQKPTKTKGLDDHFKMEIVSPSTKSSKVKAEGKTGKEKGVIESNLKRIELDKSSLIREEEPIELTSLISEDELDELETSELLTNSLANNQAEYISEHESLEENIVCSECGALVNPQEITSEGCVFCGGRKISQ